MFVKTMTPYPHSLQGFLRAPDDESGSGAPGADDGDGGDDGDGEDGGDTGQDTGRTFSQRDMDRIRIRETRKAESKARQALLAELGVNDPKEAKRIIEAAAKAAEKDKSEQDKLREQATAAQRAADEAKREAAAAKLERTVDRALVKAGVQSNRMDRIARLVHGELGDEPDEDDIKAAIDAVKDDFPEAFADNGDGDGKGRRAPSGDGRGGTPPKGQRGGAKEDPAARGADRARQMQGRTAATA